MSRNGRISGTVGHRYAPVLVAALLWAAGSVAAAQEPPKLDVFAGGGVWISEEGVGLGLGPHVGGGAWATQHLRVGGRLYSSGVLGLLSVHLRLPMDDNSDLLVGTTPVWFWPGQGGFISPAMEAFLSERISPLLRVEFGTTLDLTDEGGYIQVLGRAVYSFD